MKSKKKKKKSDCEAKIGSKKPFKDGLEAQKNAKQA